MTALTDADQDAGLRDRLEGMRIARDSFKDLAAENAIAADRYARENATLRSRATAAEDKLKDREAEIERLRAELNQRPPKPSPHVICPKCGIRRGMFPACAVGGCPSLDQHGNPIIWEQAKSSEAPR